MHLPVKQIIKSLFLRFYPLVLEVFSRKPYSTNKDMDQLCQAKKKICYWKKLCLLILKRNKNNTNLLFHHCKLCLCEDWCSFGFQSTYFQGQWEPSDHPTTSSSQFFAILRPLPLELQLQIFFFFLCKLLLAKLNNSSSSLGL